MPSHYEQGGWYEGRQYWDGQLGPVNQVMNPGESGFGQQVSEEVVKQTDPANWEYIQQQQAKESVSSSATNQPFNQPSAPSSASAGDISGAFQAPETLDITKMFANLHEQSGVSALEAELAEKERIFTEAKGDVTDNPYLSESSRAGREASLIKLHGERTKNLRDEIAVKKADTETKLNLALKQLDINSQATQQAWDQFNSLLNAGALDNASGEDVAGLVRATGIPSSMIYSAISVSRKSKEEKANTQVIQSTADSGEVTVSVINSDTGEIISQQSLGMIGNKQTGGKTSQAEQVQLIKDDLINEIRGGTNIETTFQYGGASLDPNDILRLYNLYSPYGVAQSSDEDLLESYGVKF